MAYLFTYQRVERLYYVHNIDQLNALLKGSIEIH